MATRVPFPEDVSDTDARFSRSMNTPQDYEPIQFPDRRMTPGQLARYGAWSILTGVASLVIAVWRKVT